MTVTPTPPPARGDDLKPVYDVMAYQVDAWRTGRGANTGRGLNLWCNVCNAACADEDELRAHYRAQHPELAALLEQHAQGPAPKTGEGARRRK